MKALLVASLALNVILGAVWVLRPTPPAPKVPAPVVAVAPPPAVEESGAMPAPALPQPKAWVELASRSPAELKSRLLAAGCPEATVREIVTMQICRTYRARLLAEEARAVRDWDFRKHQDPKALRERTRQQREWREQMITEVEEVTGTPWVEVRDNLLGWPRSGGAAGDYLPGEKRRALRQLDLGYRESLQEIQTKAVTEGWSAETRAQQRRLEAEREAAIANLLSPEEMQEYRMRESPAAYYARQNLPEAASESEFRAMVQAVIDAGVVPESRSMPARYGLTGDAEDPESAAREAKLKERLEAVLGADRIEAMRQVEQTRAEEARKAEEARQMAETRKMLQNVAASLGANEEAAGRFFDRLQEIQAEMDAKFKAMEQTLSGTPEEKNRQMQQAVRAALEPLATEFMGEKGTAVLERMMRRKE